MLRNLYFQNEASEQTDLTTNSEHNYIEDSNPDVAKDSAINYTDVLCNDLSNFGLKSNEWTVQPKEDYFMIQNKLDSEFQFIGIAKPSFLQWKMIQIWSL